MTCSTSLTPDQVAVLTQRLSDAEAAYHTVMTGGGIAELRHGFEAVRYNRTNAQELAAYIASLKSTLGRSGGRGRSRTIFF